MQEDAQPTSEITPLWNPPALSEPRVLTPEQDRKHGVLDYQLIQTLSLVCVMIAHYPERDRMTYARSCAAWLTETIPEYHDWEPEDCEATPALIAWKEAVAELIASRPKHHRQAKTKAEAYQLDEATFDEVDKDLAAAWILVEQAMEMDVWPSDRLMILCEVLAGVLQQFPDDEHAMRLAYAMSTVGYAHNVDVLSFECGAGPASRQDLEARYGVPADKVAERAALAPILERELGKPGHD
jgi:hypothetical protein